MSATLLSLLGTFVAFMLQLLGQIKDPHDPQAKGAKRKHIVKWMSIPLLIVSLLIGGYSTLKSDNDKAKSTGEIKGLTDSVKTLQTINETQHSQDLAALQKVNDQLAELKTSARTEELRRKMGALQGEIDQYMKANPKTELESGLWVSQDEPLALEKYISVEGTKASFTVGLRNMTPTYAKNIEMWVTICKICSFASEPTSSLALPENGDKMRYWHNINLAQKVSYNATIEVDIPRPYTDMWANVRYTCENCAQTSDKAMRLILGRTGLPFLQSPASKIPAKPARKP